MAITFKDVPSQGVSVALGNFDGVHKGHLAVINNAVKIAEEKGCVPCALLFNRHPMADLKGSAPPSLMTRDMQDRALKKAGIEKIFRLDFSDIRHMPPEDFVKEILFSALGAKGIACGYNYRFGENAAGTTETLSRLCEESGTELRIAPKVEVDGIPVSSTAIRSALEKGDVNLANRLLGRLFSYDFTVISGDRRGRLLGAPTINQHFPEGFVTPRFGVYAAAAFVDGALHPAVTNFGIRPTIGTNSLRSETCILNFSGDLYGCNVPVGLIAFLRDEIKFSDLDHLGRQIASDGEKARKIFEEFSAEHGTDKSDIF